MSLRAGIPEAAAGGRRAVAGGPAPEAWLQAWLMPLWRRVQVGEGVLLAVNLAALWRWSAGPREGALLAALSLLVIAAGYEFNDLWDSASDLRNPRKDQALVKILRRHSRGFRAALAVEMAALLLAAYVWAGPAAAAAVLAAFAANALYSLGLKGVPVADALCVGACGAAYTAITGASRWFCAAVGLFTAICHVFQMLGDRDVDAKNGVTTTAVASRRLALALLAALSAALFLVLRWRWGLAAGLTAALPVALGRHRDARRAWVLTKVYCAAVLCAALALG